MKPHEEIAELLAAYALDALSPDDAGRVAEHVAGCRACQAELRAYRAVADRLPLAAPLAQPPARVKQALMRRVAARQAPRLAAAQPGARTRGWREWLVRLSPAWSAVSLVLVIALAASTFALWRQLDALRPTPQVGALRQVQLTGTQAAPEATGLLVLSLDGEYGTLVVDRLPALDRERQYQLWLLRDGQRESGGVFSVGADGYASLSVQSSQPLASYSSFGITIEPAGGSPGPTGERVLGGAP